MVSSCLWLGVMPGIGLDPAVQVVAAALLPGLPAPRKQRWPGQQPADVAMWVASNGSWPGSGQPTPTSQSKRPRAAPGRSSTWIDAIERHAAHNPYIVGEPPAILSPARRRLHAGGSPRPPHNSATSAQKSMSSRGPQGLVRDPVATGSQSSRKRLIGSPAASIGFGWAQQRDGCYYHPASGARSSAPPMHRPEVVGTLLNGGSLPCNCIPLSLMQ